VLFHPLILELPALPVLGYLHAFFPASIETLGPFFSCCRAAADGVVHLLRDFLDMLLVVVFGNVHVGWRSHGLQCICSNVVLVVCE
jgi:hypothetical protein